MRDIRAENIVLLLPILGCFQFITLTTIAMLFYPGGTYFDSKSTGYSFFTNFFSDLGRTVSYSGEFNLISAFLFIIALVLSGISIIIFFNYLPKIMPDYIRSQRYFNITRYFGIISGISFIGIAFTPSNINSILHDFLVVIGFSCILFTSLGLMWITYKNKINFRVFASAYLVLIVCILIYAIIGVFTFQIETQESLFLKVAIQKLVVYAMNGCFILQSIGFYLWKKKSH